MHSVFVLFLFAFSFCSASALPCDVWSPGGTNNIVLAHPAEEEIILLTFSEDDNENLEDSYRISTDDGLNHNLSGEVVDSPASKGHPEVVKSDAISRNETEVPHQTERSLDVDEDVGVTTESLKVV